MKLKRLAASAVASITAAIGLGVVTASPALATDVGSWRAYGSSNPIASNWHCGPTVSNANGLSAQSCVIRSNSLADKVQAALIVRNRLSTAISTWASIYLLDDTYPPSQVGEGDYYCASSGLAPKSVSVCFGTTETYNGWARSYGSSRAGTTEHSPLG
ncbi:hypothetical protein ACIBSW_17170 [Actinoplanes sp. NPDC049668]|uniref:hypothetical protein n=1 Tax=unclassified Actinoplanes TaxID=2626549 RepID=UPI0033A67511